MLEERCDTGKILRINLKKKIGKHVPNIRYDKIIKVSSNYMKYL